MRNEARVRVYEGGDWTITGRSLSSRRYVFRAKGRAAYNRQEFVMYFREHGWMVYIVPDQPCGRKAC